MSELPAIADSLTELIRASNVSQSDMRPELYAQAYPELRKLAMNWLYRHGGADHLQTTEVLNEGYLRFLQTPEVRAHDRASFFAFASSIIRSVVFDAVRRTTADKRGGNLWITSLNTTLCETVGNPDSEFLELEQAITQLEVVDPRLAYVVDMHFFAEMSMQEIADTLDVNEKTVRRDWKKAQLLLKSMLR
jgi:RNA polymerase sigma factor (TIGR02999 family)